MKLELCECPRTPFPATLLPVADLHSKIFDAPSPGQTFLDFQAVFSKIWPNNKFGLAQSTPEYHVCKSALIRCKQDLVFRLSRKILDSYSLIPDLDSDT